MLPAEPYKDYIVGEYKSSDDFYVERLDSISEIVTRIVDVEGPIHQQELARRTASVWDINRVGSRIQQRVDMAIRMAITEGRIRRKTDFLWPKDMKTPPVRCRQDNGVRNIEYICNEEIGRSACLLLKAQFGMNREDLIAQTARVLGFSSTGSRIADRIEKAISAEIKAGRITISEDALLKVAENE